MVTRKTALVLTDPQNDVLSERGVAWGLVGSSVRENWTGQNPNGTTERATIRENGETADAEGGASVVTTLRAVLAWVTAPAVGQVPGSHAVAVAALRILIGLLWLYNLSWKRAPDFGRESGNGLYGFTQDALEHPVFAPYSWVVENLVLPNFIVFGWTVILVETALAVLLLTGAFVRIAALVGIGQSLAIGLSVAATPGEWPWSYWMMIAIHVVILFSAAGQVLAVDGLRARRGPPAEVRKLVLAWGGVVTVAAVVTLILSLGEDPLASAGTRLGGPDLSIGLGSYNLLGGAVLLLVGVGLLGSMLMRNRGMGLISAGLGVIAAVSLYAQIGFSDPLLGGSYTSAAFFLCAALVGLSSWSSSRRRSETLADA